jgi:hypothetical protein
MTKFLERAGSSVFYLTVILAGIWAMYNPPKFLGDTLVGFIQYGFIFYFIEAATLFMKSLKCFFEE